MTINDKDLTRYDGQHGAHGGLHTTADRERRRHIHLPIFVTAEHPIRQVGALAEFDRA